MRREKRERERERERESERAHITHVPLDETTSLQEKIVGDWRTGPY